MNSTKSSDKFPIIGQGGWHIGDDPRKEKDEIATLRRGIELGLNLIDTAEMYGNGNSEILIGKAIKNIPREDYIIVSKVYPHNAGKQNIFISCDNSLKKLGIDYLDLYLLHWRGSIPLAETVDCMERLISTGKIKRWGVSNFDVSDMEELFNVPNGHHCYADQVLYNLTSRGIEYDLIPWLNNRNVLTMAYCPLAQAGKLMRMNRNIFEDSTLRQISAKYEITIMQLMLAFTLRQTNLTAIPKASSINHVEANAMVLNVNISDEDWEMIDEVFQPPTSKMHLDIE